MLAIALGTHLHFLPRLRQLLALRLVVPSDTTPAAAAAARERVLMFSAYLVSLLAGKTAAIDFQLLDLRFLPALAEAVRSAGVGAAGVRRAALRAIAKLLESQPSGACAAAQLVACGGVHAVAALLPHDGVDHGAACKEASSRVAPKAHQRCSQCPLAASGRVLLEPAVTSAHLPAILTPPPPPCSSIPQQQASPAAPWPSCTLRQESHPAALPQQACCSQRCWLRWCACWAAAAQSSSGRRRRWWCCCWRGNQARRCRWRQQAPSRHL